ncbi:MAG: hypothetical protein ABJC04_01305 [Verrucomicrobiota bacterium]
MDLIFKCIHCDQELAVNPAGAGTEIPCPTCGQKITIPEPTPQTLQSINPISTSAAAKEIKQFNVPLRDKPSEVLVKKIDKPEVTVNKDGVQKLHLRTIKRTECLEVNHDKFDETVSVFLGKIGTENLVSITPISYTHLDLNTRQNMMDYGVIIVYKS